MRPEQGPLAWVRFIKILLHSALRIQWGKQKPRKCAGERENWKQEVGEMEGWGKGGGVREEAGGEGTPRSRCRSILLVHSYDSFPSLSLPPAPGAGIIVGHNDPLGDKGILKN